MGHVAVTEAVWRWMRQASIGQEGPDLPMEDQVRATLTMLACWSFTQFLFSILQHCYCTVNATKVWTFDLDHIMSTKDFRQMWLAYWTKENVNHFLKSAKIFPELLVLFIFGVDFSSSLVHYAQLPAAVWGSRRTLLPWGQYHTRESAGNRAYTFI